MAGYSDYSQKEREYYEQMLKLLGSLSKLFSENSIPYLDSRIAENLFCKAFSAENKGREDSSVDAVKNNTGVGIKTFMGTSAQKIAEFNKALLEFSDLSGIEKVEKIAELRNKRINFTKRNYGIDDLRYHCIRRIPGKFLICEYPMDLVELENIKIIEETSKSIKFSDGKNRYSFNVSKSVLLKDFQVQEPCSTIDIKIIEDPFEVLSRKLDLIGSPVIDSNKLSDFIVLPLYAFEKNKKVVPLKSGLNQWNAGGRNRNKDEVYIRIPSWIHKKFPDFFPSRDSKFELRLPSGESISAKVCQDGSKALMSDPNKALGKWVLRDVLQLREGEVLNYKTLQEIGIDSVRVEKISPDKYSIDFREEGEFEEFEEENHLK